MTCPLFSGSDLIKAYCLCSGGGQSIRMKGMTSAGPSRRQSLVRTSNYREEWGPDLLGWSTLSFKCGQVAGEMVMITLNASASSHTAPMWMVGHGGSISLPHPPGDLLCPPYLCWTPCLSLSWFTYWFWWNSTSRSFLRYITRKIKSFEIIHVWRKLFPKSSVWMMAWLS